MLNKCIIDIRGFYDRGRQWTKFIGQFIHPVGGMWCIFFLASYEFHFIIETGRSSTAPSTCSTRERDKLDPAVKKILSECAR